jgi:hypothetical protein
MMKCKNNVPLAIKPQQLTANINLTLVTCTYRNLVVRPEGTRPLGRPTHRWEDNIKIYLKETG